MKSMSVVIAAMMLSSASVPAQPSTANADRQAVEAVLARYKVAIERLDASGTEELFAADSEIFETGGVEGSYANYLAHHLAPELAEFKSFQFSDYKVAVRLEGSIALASESYRYRIEPKSGEAAVRLGVATSVLKKVDGGWKIISMHNSARRPRVA